MGELAAVIKQLQHFFHFFQFLYILIAEPLCVEHFIGRFGLTDNAVFLRSVVHFRSF